MQIWKIGKTKCNLFTFYSMALLDLQMQQWKEMQCMMGTMCLARRYEIIQGLTMFKTILLQQNAAEAVIVEQERSQSQVKSTQQ